jgi:hypothetical protein
MLCLSIALDRTGMDLGAGSRRGTRPGGRPRTTFLLPLRLSPRSRLLCLILLSSSVGPSSWELPSTSGFVSDHLRSGTDEGVSSDETCALTSPCLLTFILACVNHGSVFTHPVSSSCCQVVYFAYLGSMAISWTSWTLPSRARFGDLSLKSGDVSALGLLAYARLHGRPCEIQSAGMLRGLRPS